MNEERTAGLWSERVALIAGLFASQLGLLVLVGWYTENAALIQLQPHLPPMPFNAALAFLIAGAGLSAAAFHFAGAALIAGALASAIGLVTLIEYAVRVDFGFDALLMEPYITVSGLYPGRMRPITAFSFVLAGTALAVAGRATWRARGVLFLRLAGAVLVAVGVVCFFGGTTGIPLTSLWGRVTGMALHTAVGMFAAGVALVGLGWNEQAVEEVGWRVGLPALVAIAFGTMTLMLWQGLLSEEHAQLERTVQLATTKVRDAIRAQTETQIRALISMARRWEQWENLPGVWEYDAGLYMRDHPAYESIQWIDGSFRVQWRVPPDQGAAVPVPDLEALLETARARREVVLSRAFSVREGEKAFVVAVPIFRRPDFRESAGFIVARCRVSALFDAILREHGVQGYSVVVYDGREEMYRRGSARERAPAAGGHHGSVELHSAEWRVRVWPEPSLLDEEDSAAPEAALVVGLLMTALVSMVVYFAHAVQLRAREAEAANHKLENEVGERKRAEEALARKAAELARSNQELEQFAYVASHDLQEPLRKIQAFGDRLAEECKESVGENGVDYVQRMQSAAARMQALIDDLLELSRVTTMGRAFVPVDLDVVAREVISDLEASIERAGARVEVGHLPTVQADPMQMRQLLQNLISNALKFHRPDQPPVVAVYGSLFNDQGSPRCQITVSDNGIGFDEQYLDRIFAVFQRLHGRNQYEGTGVGLALCRKIVERHGGRITARSAPGEGATFVVTLPAMHDETGAKT